MQVPSTKMAWQNRATKYYYGKHFSLDCILSCHALSLQKFLSELKYGKMCLTLFCSIPMKNESCQWGHVVDSLPHKGEVADLKQGGCGRMGEAIGHQMPSFTLTSPKSGE